MRAACERQKRPLEVISPGQVVRFGFGLVLLTLLTGCGAIGGSPPTPVVVVVTVAPPSPVVVVVTATPGPPTPAAAATPPPSVQSTPVAAGKPTISSTPTTATKPAVATQAATPAAKPTAPAATPTPGAQTLTVGRTTSYRGLLFTVEEARSGEKIEGQTAGRGKMLVGVRLRLHNSTDLHVSSSGGSIEGLIRLRLPGGVTRTPEMMDDDLLRPDLQPQSTLNGWAFFELDRPVPLESLVLALGGSQETVVTIPFSGPEPKVVARRFEYLRSTEPVRGLIWSVSGGELRLDIPGQQANPGQEFIVVKIRATNPSTQELRLWGPNGELQNGTDYLRVRADNGVLLQISAELSALPLDFPPKAEQDTLYAWQLPLGSKNPKLVILSPDLSEHELELGPLPPP
jgi:hypothetical protein